MQETNNSSSSSQGSIRFFTLLVLACALIFLVIVLFPIRSGFSKIGLVEKVNTYGLLDPANAQKILSGDFKDSRFPNDAAAAKRNEYRIYDTQYDYLRTRYYAGDEKALILAKQWREMLKTQFPEMYAQSERLNPTAFEISERLK